MPILWDNLHHECLNEGEPPAEAARMACQTWDKARDGNPMFDYSSQEPGARKGNHAQRLNAKHFAGYLQVIKGLQVDIMLEIKDKEASALRALELIRGNAKPGDDDDAAAETSPAKIAKREQAE